MKKHLSFHNITFIRFCQYIVVCLALSCSLVCPSAFASANDFFFEDFVADYYLSKNSDGTSTLHVKEVLTAVFPNTDQNHGIVRAIPFTNQDGHNRTIADESSLNLTVLRNGNPEPVAKIESENNAYNIYTGTASTYVHGRQVYTLEYDFQNVITEFDADKNNVSGQPDANIAFQELYWDTNGTGWSQTFHHLSATFHLDKTLVENLLPDSWCYVGRQGSSNQDRCHITHNSDGFTFETGSVNHSVSDDDIDTLDNTNDASDTDEIDDADDFWFGASYEDSLFPGENLTFVVQFEPGTFTVIRQESYALLILFVIEAIVCICIIVAALRFWRKRGRENAKLAKELFVAPQYTPPANISVAEAEQLYLKSTRSSYVATLLELAVSGRISIVKDTEKQGILKKDQWSIKVIQDNPLTGSQRDMLEILNGGFPFHAGDTITIKKHTPTSHLETLGRNYRLHAIRRLETSGLFIKETTKSNTTVGLVSGILIFAIFCMPSFGLALFAIVMEVFAGTYLVGQEFAIALSVPIAIATIIVSIIILARTSKYSKYSRAGITLSNYLDGLKLYIKMAEADRLKFLQSTTGADVSNEGIVKLYEKLLPYACLFGLEESWLKELNKYYEVANLSPSWCNDTISNAAMISAFHSISSSTSSSIGSSTSYSSSSSSSGGGGGGHSGGGGGGGGGGGW